jgi:hypothetical protein
MAESLALIAFTVLILAVPGYLLYRTFVTPDIELRVGERLILKTRGTLSINTLIASGVGSIYLTDQRLLWQPSWSVFAPLFPAPPRQELKLTDISSVYARSKDDPNKVGLLHAFLRPQEALRASKLEIAVQGHVFLFGFIDWNPFRAADEPGRWKEALLKVSSASETKRFLPESVVAATPTRAMTFSKFVSFFIAGLTGLGLLIVAIGAAADGDIVWAAVGLVMLVFYGGMVAYYWKAWKPLDKSGGVQK